MRNNVPSEELIEEIKAFQNRWNIQRRSLRFIFNLPEGTIDSIMHPTKSRMVKWDTAQAIRISIRNYNPRTCEYRRISKSEAAKWLRSIKAKHDCKWDDVAEMVGLKESKIRQINSEGSDQRYVDINVMRDMMMSYNDYLYERSKRYVA